MTPPCPFLPLPDRLLTHEDIHALGTDRTVRFHEAALAYGQTMWLTAFPAKALLLVSRAMSCRLEDVSFLTEQAMPYHAVAWILQNRPADRFIGNPRLHYQHLATRMVAPHKELRTWRAWACWQIARLILTEAEFPPDTRQIRAESTIEPRRAEIASHLERLSPCDDLAAWEAAIAWACPGQAAHHHEARIEIVPISGDQVSEVHDLAHRIWPEVYPSIISMEQIHHMLEEIYNVARMQREISERGARYALIREDDRNVGYLAWQPQGEKSAFLSKLYLLPGHHGRGLGARGLQWIEEQARAAGCERITLRVNKQNRAAIRAYLRAGFAFASDVCTEIGGGFVMDDHEMSKTL